MALDQSSPKKLFNDMRRHIGHHIECVRYGMGKDIWNVAIECHDCDEVLLDQDHPDVEGA